MPSVVRLVLAVAVVLALALPAGASAAPPPGFVGMTADDLFGNQGAYRDKALAQQQAAGVQLLRVTFNWSAIEFAPNGFDLSWYDRYVLDAAKHNITFLPVLVNAPDFRSTKPARGATRYLYPPRDNADMANWAVELVDRYGPNGTLWQENPASPRGRSPRGRSGTSRTSPSTGSRSRTPRQYLACSGPSAPRSRAGTRTRR